MSVQEAVAYALNSQSRHRAAVEQQQQLPQQQQQQPHINGVYHDPQNAYFAAHQQQQQTSQPSEVYRDGDGDSVGSNGYRQVLIGSKDCLNKQLQRLQQQLCSSSNAQRRSKWGASSCGQWHSLTTATTAATSRLHATAATTSTSLSRIKRLFVYRLWQHLCNGKHRSLMVLMLQ